MKKVESGNDITPRNDLVGGINRFGGNPNLFGTNKIEIQKTYATPNLESAKKREKSVKAAKSLGDLIKAVAVVVAATTTGIVGVGSILPENLPKVEISEVYAFENEVSYFVSLDRYEEGLKIVLYNDFTDREQDMDGTAMEGTFEDLQVDMTYTFAIKKGSKIIESKKVVTRREEPYTEDPITGDGDWGNNNNGTTG